MYLSLSLFMYFFCSRFNGCRKAENLREKRKEHKKVRVKYDCQRVATWEFISVLTINLHFFELYSPAANSI